MTLAEALDVRTTGPVDGSVVVLVHGFGCGQSMWRQVAPVLGATHRVISFDLPGSGGADDASYDPTRHARLEGYRDDVLALLDELDLSDVTLVGHSVAAMIGVLASIEAPQTVARLVLVAPSARYVDDGDYVGGFAAADIDELVELMQRNHLGWQEPLAELVSGDGGPAAREELYESFCRTRPEVAAQFADVTFRGDNRADLPRVTVPTLVLQSAHDLVAPLTAGRFVHEQIPDSRFAVIDTAGHCPHLTAPGETSAAILDFLGRVPTAA
ncbi:alpha/beta hydrolase [Nocardioidaceae bacterium]|nr:alpha/beta hydrolase [Nocardioidaceae bacterium]